MLHDDIFTVSLSWAQTCPSYEAGFTGSATGKHTPDTATVYINTEEPAPCNGTVYGWHYCSDEASGTSPLQVQLAMYRSFGEDSYLLVSGSRYELRVEDGIDSYTCQDEFLEPSEHFSVEQGDMVAACWSSENRVELFADKRRHDLIIGGQCSQDSIDEFTVKTRRTLLLSAYISK